MVMRARSLSFVLTASVVLGAVPVGAAAGADRWPDPGVGTVVGTVRFNGVRPVGAEVEVQGPDYAWATTDTQGRFSLSLAPGSYRVSVSAYPFPTFWAPGVAKGGLARVVAVTDGQVTRADVTAEYQPKFPGRPHERARGPKAPARLAMRAVDPLGGYDGQARCIHRAQRGTKSLAKVLRRTYGNYRIGLNRSCVKGDTSEHYDGRAIDWMVDSRSRPSAQAGDDFVKWLTMARGLNLGERAARLGVMYVIWRGRIWKSYQADLGWQEYSNCLDRSRTSRSQDSDCHRNHVHISLTWAGARKKTSWWR